MHSLDDPVYCIAGHYQSVVQQDAVDIQTLHKHDVNISFKMDVIEKVQAYKNFQVWMVMIKVSSEGIKTNKKICHWAVRVCK